MAGEEVPLPSPSAHRLPTVSASQALQNLHARGIRTVSTGISQLDKVLAAPSLPGHPVIGGYTRGKVTEIFGPSGIGKTAFGIQAAVSALQEGQHIVWVDAACSPLIPHRFNDVLSAPSDSPPELSPDEVRDHFHYVAATTISHLLALFMHPPASFPQPNTSLVIIDSLSTLIENGYPRNTDNKNKTEQLKWAANRRFAVVNELIQTFTKFAALHNVALLITCPSISRIRGENRALLAPAMSGVEWENGISTRLVLFRDWVPRQAKPINRKDAEKLSEARFVGVVKANGVALTDEGGVGRVVPFTIDNTGLHDLSIAAVDISAPMVSREHSRPRKRSFAEFGEEEDEILNSDELYGWVEEDEVATEGLAVDEAQDTNDFEDAESPPEHTTEIAVRPSHKIARLATL